MEISQLGANPAAAASEVAGAKLAENFDTFLQLLTTQLQHQDPLSPMESNEFVAQLVQFSEVEQAIASNKSLEKLIDLQNTNQATAAIGYIGQTVEAAGSGAHVSGLAPGLGSAAGAARRRVTRSRVSSRRPGSSGLVR